MTFNAAVEIRSVQALIAWLACVESVISTNAKPREAAGVAVCNYVDLLHLTVAFKQRSNMLPHPHP